MKSFRKNKNGIILIIVLWVLFFLSVTVLTLGYKNRINIRLRSMGNDELRVFYLAKEGINRVIIRLADDEQGFDSLKDAWGEKFNLEKDDVKISVEVVDEDRFLNVNLLSEEMLNNIQLIFNDVTAEDIKTIYKMRPFNVAKEFQDIMLTAEHKFYTTTATGEMGLHELITTFGDGKLNINTAREELLLMIPNMTQRMVDDIIERRKNAPFEKNETLSEDLSLLGLTPAQVSSLIKVAKVDSSIFRIKAKATLAHKKVSKELEAVIKRKDGEFNMLYLKEN